MAHGGFEFFSYSTFIDTTTQSSPELEKLKHHNAVKVRQTNADKGPTVKVFVGQVPLSDHLHGLAQQLCVYYLASIADVPILSCTAGSGGGKIKVPAGMEQRLFELAKRTLIADLGGFWVAQTAEARADVYTLYHETRDLPEIHALSNAPRPRGVPRSPVDVQYTLARARR